MNATGLANERTVSLTRAFDAPRELVYRMWTDPKHMAQWWGPKGFSNPVCEMDVRAGGKMRIDMRAPDGTVYPMTGVFHEVVPNKRLVFTAVAEESDGRPQLTSHTIVTFEESAGKTTVFVYANALGLAPVAPQMLAGMEQGWSGSLDRLAELVARVR